MEFRHYPTSYFRWVKIIESFDRGRSRNHKVTSNSQGGTTPYGILGWFTNRSFFSSRKNGAALRPHRS
jgi:hypothetical protein